MATHQGRARPCFCGEPGWMQGIVHVPIQWTKPAWIRQREGDMRAIALVDHIAQGWLSTMEAWAADGGSKVIAHFGIGRGGRRVQFQEVTTPGIHVSAINRPQAARVIARGEDAGTTGANGYTVGIEHEGCSIEPPYGVPPEIIYSDANPWPDAMVDASVSVKEWCFETVPTLGVPSRDSIIGHYEVDAHNRPDDPAAASDRDVWQVDRMITMLDKGDDMQPGYDIVLPGETLTSFAARNGITVPKAQQLNGIEDANRVGAWQPLRTRDDVKQPPLLSYTAGTGGAADTVRTALTRAEGAVRIIGTQQAVLDDAIGDAQEALEKSVAPS